jgi:hypothetical protein
VDGHLGGFWQLVSESDARSSKGPEVVVMEHAAADAARAGVKAPVMAVRAVIETELESMLARIQLRVLTDWLSVPAPMPFAC